MAVLDQKEKENSKEKEKQIEKTSEDEENKLPSNPEYLSYYVHQEEWKPTRPLKPVGAVFNSPGPATVNLPPTIGEEHHDLTKPKAPSYKMGIKLHKKDLTTGPGPGTYDVNVICKVTNSGKENPKAPRFGRAQRFHHTEDVRSPGPAAYNRDGGDKFIYSAAPSYSMSRSHRSKLKTPFSPAPNAYTLPSGIGPGTSPLVMGPSYSMGKAKRIPDAKLEMSPGPASYLLPSTNVNLSKSPGFYIGRKVAPPRTCSSSPGPGAYGTHLVKFDKYSTPRITFGIRHSPFKVLPGFAAEK